jgi:hypothetical protein
MPASDAEPYKRVCQLCALGFVEAQTNNGMQQSRKAKNCSPFASLDLRHGWPTFANTTTA